MEKPQLNADANQTLKDEANHSDDERKNEEEKQRRIRVTSKMKHFDLDEQEQFLSDRNGDTDNASFLYSKFHDAKTMKSSEMNSEGNNFKFMQMNKKNANMTLDPAFQHNRSHIKEVVTDNQSPENLRAQNASNNDIDFINKNPNISKNIHEESFESPLKLKDAFQTTNNQLSNVFVHKVEPEVAKSIINKTQINDTTTEERKLFKDVREKPLKQQDLKSEAIGQSERPLVIELPDFDPLSPFTDEKPDIQFHRSPRNMDELQFIDKLNKSNCHQSKDITSAHNSVERILGRIPKEYFRVEARYESIDAILDHITK